MIRLGIDCETYRIRRGLLAPRLVALSVAGLRADGGAAVVEALGGRCSPRAGGAATVLDAVGAARVWPELLARAARGEVQLIGHVLPYDLAVLLRSAGGTHGGVWRAITRGAAVDTRARERLLRLAAGELEVSASGRTGYTLADLTRRYLGVELGGKVVVDGAPAPWRVRYDELAHVPLADWPDAAVDYSADDAWWALAVSAAQLAAAPDTIGGVALLEDGRRAVVGEGREVAAAWALHLAATWGVRTDPARVAETLAAWDRGEAAGVAVARRRGWIRENGTRDLGALRAAVVEALGDAAPRTAPTDRHADGQVQTSEEVLVRCGGDLAEYGAAVAFGTVRSRWGAVLPIGTSRPITSRPEYLVETGRTAWSDPPWQQPPAADLYAADGRPLPGGVRACVVPRHGWVLCSVDYDTIELCALAQVCLWAGLGSGLADEINAGRDVHLATAAALLRIDYAEAAARRAAGDSEVKDARQLAKALNFGLPGGLSARSFVSYARGYGVDLDLQRAVRLVEEWHASRPEVRAYFAWVERVTGARGGEPGTVRQFTSGRVRGGVRLTAAYNGYFQGLVADGAKSALGVLSALAYGAEVDDHPLARELVSPGDAVSVRGVRPILFLHDEVISELPEDGASEAGDAMARILVRVMQRHIPDVRVSAEPALMRRWEKGARTVRDAAGRLVVPRE